MSRQDRWRIEFLPSARRELLALGRSVQDHLRDAIRSLADDPFPADSIEMRGKGLVCGGCVSEVIASCIAFNRSASLC